MCAKRGGAGEKGVDMFIYTKVKNTWKCSRCTLDNPLVDDFEYVTRCQACSENMCRAFGAGADLPARVTRGTQAVARYS